MAQLFRECVDDLHGTDRLLREQGGKVLQTALVLVAEAGADRRVDDADAVQGQTEYGGETLTVAVGVAARLPDGKAVHLPVGDAAARLQGDGGREGSGVGLLQDEVGFAQPGFGVAAGENDGVAGSQVAGRPHARGVRVQGLLRVEDGREPAVLDADEAEGLLGYLRGVSGDSRHLVADMPDGAFEDVDGGVGARSAAALDAAGGCIAVRDNSPHAQQPFRLRDVETGDFGVRVGAAQNLAPEHAGQGKVGDVPGLAGHL